ncbi:MAG: hypothetical protein A2571_00700 [Candidatus Vogelbacteria bacterium RIFOXYD1_FULL_44_32]|uniref:TraC-like domain-containing protein n=1 Tax=Candidatus Vogelbacteria bacterium RIFOXYD1_FULL_44_32 TaxID=1802438 RepID=A0A1G2QEI0_9BACT|nr:MAG: hypothetical protein A2571_00700 [Candidatus Vogelbacteria bacterium RIFOXYD1_FULL_44_32]
MALTNSSTQDFIPIKEIRENVVILKDGSMRAVLIASSLNFALKSVDERTAILLQYQNFLNSLDFHIQFFIESKKLDIRPYITAIEERGKEQTNELIKVQTREYVEFIKNFTEVTNIMTKSFFVVVPYSTPIIETRGFMAKIPLLNSKKSRLEANQTDNFREYKIQLEQRISVVQDGLNRIGVRTTELGTEELVELYFKIFNPGETSSPNIKNL